MYDVGGDWHDQNILSDRWVVVKVYVFDYEVNVEIFPSVSFQTLQGNGRETDRKEVGNSQTIFKFFNTECDLESSFCWQGRLYVFHLYWRIFITICLCESGSVVSTCYLQWCHGFFFLLNSMEQYPTCNYQQNEFILTFFFISNQKKNYNLLLLAVVFILLIIIAFSMKIQLEYEIEWGKLEWWRLYWP